jgi:eukaryotic-like serine/threonine-protein kinase
MFKGLFNFLKSETFLKNIAIYFLSLGIIIWLLLSYLRVYTNHGESVNVPDFKGVPIAKLDEVAAKNHVRYLIVDSVFDAKAPRGIVLKQEPEFNAEVKEGREVYLYVSASLPPEIIMPKLVDRSLRQAITMIFANGFRLGKINFVADECRNCVLEQRVNGKIVSAGKKVSKGGVVDLTAGRGLKDITARMPCLYGLTKNEAVIKLAESSLAVGKIRYDGMKEMPQAKVYRQTPSCDIYEESLEIGSTVDIFLTAIQNKIPEIPVDTVINTKSEDEGFDN